MGILRIYGRLPIAKPRETLCAWSFVVFPNCVESLVYCALLIVRSFPLIIPQVALPDDTYDLWSITRPEC